MINNFNQLEIIANSDNPDFIILAETHLTENVEESEISLQNYNHYATLSNSTRTGGVIIYFKSQWSITKIFEKISDSKFWISAYMAKYNQSCFIILALYRSPSSPKAEFCDVFENILEDLCEKSVDIIIAGDFNIDWKKDNFYKEKIENLLNDNGLKQIVTEYTRITQYSKTLIDYVITNNERISVTNNINNKISDHESINIAIECTQNNKEQIKEIQIFKYDKIQFKRELRNLTVQNIPNEVNSKALILDSCIENTIKKFTSTKVVNEKYNTKKWFNRALNICKKTKIIKYQTALSVNTEEAWNDYRIYRNIYKVNVENAKNKFTSDKINKSTNQKEMWREIKDLVLKKPRDEINNVIFNNIEYKDNFEIANNFNMYFVNSIKAIRDSIPNVQYINRVPVINNRFKFRAITIVELKNICKKLKKKPDYNNVSTKIILDNWDIIGHFLMDIINKSFETGIFPETWKHTMVMPIKKIPKTNKCEEYRPINVLKTCEKIIEKVVKEQLDKYIEENKILSEYQSGFRKKYSCETAVNYVVNRWKYSKKNSKILAIFLDFKRAFETIDRDILINKLCNYGIQDTELNWFKSYLFDREQRTKVNNVTSNSIKTEFGVPQGSILGAILFTLYINDMPNILKKCEITMYADDTLIFAEADTEQKCHENLNFDMENINTWLKMNKLKLNESKTKLMEINMNSNIEFKINDKIIEKVKNIKYLGFIIDSDLKFKDHIDYICRKIGKKIGFFKRIRNKINTINSINIYNTIVKPHFEYGSTILYTCCTKQQIERLQKLQNKAMRSILKCNRYTSTRSMLDALKWLNIYQRLEFNTLNFIQKLKSGNSAEYLTKQLQYVGEVQPYNLRNADNFRLQRVTTSAMQKSLFYKGLHLYNKLDPDIRNETNINIFKRKVIYFVRNNMN